MRFDRRCDKQGDRGKGEEKMKRDEKVEKTIDQSRIEKMMKDRRTKGK